MTLAPKNNLGLTTVEELLTHAQVVANRTAMSTKAEIGTWHELLGGKTLLPFTDRKSVV